MRRAAARANAIALAPKRDAPAVPTASGATAHDALFVLLNLALGLRGGLPVVVSPLLLAAVVPASIGVGLAPPPVPDPWGDGAGDGLLSSIGCPPATAKASSKSDLK